MSSAVEEIALNAYAGYAQKVRIMNLASKYETITSLEAYTEAGLILKDLKEHRKKIVDYFKPLKEKAYAAHKEITTREADELKQFDRLDQLVRDAISVYLKAQEKIRQEAQRKADEQARLEAENERQRLLEKAVKAEEKGKTEKAEDLLDAAANIYEAPVIVDRPVPKTTKFQGGGGITAKKDIAPEITDIKLALNSVIEDKLPITCVEFKMGVIKTHCKNLNVKGGEIPGVFVHEISGVIVR